MLAETQIGGKYDATDSSIFALKHKLQSVGVRVTHPISDRIISTIEGRGYTFDSSQVSFLDVETDYYRSIAASDFHTINNRFHADLGYVGGSTSLEMTYAMLHRKPILLMHHLQFAASADQACVDIITEREQLLHIYNISTMALAEIQEVVINVKGREVDYDLSRALGEMIMSKVNALFDHIRNLPIR